MLTLTCPHCGEPWDNDELHDSPHVDYQTAFKLFREFGCGAFEEVYDGVPAIKCKHDPCVPEEMLKLYRALNDDCGAEYAEELCNNWELIELGDGALGQDWF